MTPEEVARNILDMTSHVINGNRWGDDHCIATDAELITDAAKMVRDAVKSEREACARIFDRAGNAMLPAEKCANLIRMRSEE